MSGTAANIKEPHILNGLIQQAQEDARANASTSFHFENIMDDLTVTLPDWTVKGMIESNTITNLYGPPGCGKTFQAVAMARCICTGTDYFGMKVKQGPVLYFLGEGKNGLRRRIKAWNIRNEMHQQGNPLYVSSIPAMITDEAFMQTVANEIKRIVEETGQEPVAVFIDTLARNFGPGDENRSEHMGPFINNIDKYLRSQYGAAIIIIHHTGKDDERGPRGSSAFKAAVDHQYRIKALGNGAEVQRGFIICEKNKEGKPLPPIGFRLDEVEIGLVDEDGKQVTSVAAMPEDIDVRLMGLNQDGEPANKNKGERQRQAAEELRIMFEENRTTLQKQGHDPEDARVRFDDLIDRLNSKYKTSKGKPAFSHREAKKRVRELIPEMGYVLTGDYIDQIETIF